jgi:hypothetical protein
MNLSIHKNNKEEIVVRLTTEEVGKRLESAVFDLIAVRLADKYVQENADYLLHNIIDVASLKEEVALIIKNRLVDETKNKIQKP